MTTSQATAYTGLGPSRLRTAVRNGELKAEKEETPRGPVLWFSKDELDRWTAARERAAQERKGRPGRPLRVNREEEP